MSKFNVWLIFWCAVMMIQPWMNQSHALAADAVNATAVQSTSGLVTGEATTAKTTASPQAVVKSSTRQEAAKEIVAGAPTVTPTTDPVTGPAGPKIEKARLGSSVRLITGLLSGLHRTKRRLSLLNDTLMPRSGPQKGGHASSAPVDTTTSAPPKMDLELSSPTMMEDSEQQELDYQPQMVAKPLAEDFLLNEPENDPHGGHTMTSSKYRCMHMSSPVLPPIFIMLQQLLQPSPMMETATEMHHSPITSQLFELLNDVEDMTLQNIPNVIERLLANRFVFASGTQLDNKDKGTQQDDDVSENDELKKEAAEVAPTHDKDEIVLVCPLHHEHHANHNGEIIDDNVIHVDQCHVV
ncbi:GL17659 [Drosophila persimilis]|uniref:GL17659 n=1 Tax=Drosophila persimilis TaxID=7234 RepID=B4GI58_DROPE|nr:uncharacterized protein LOC6593110 [Drosophila persimilis]EDW36178.1 GL17659 [Drosophila persimilis]